MQSNTGLLNVVIVSWSTNIQSSIAADSTDAELKSLYSAVKKITSLRHFLTSSSIHTLLQHPLIVYADNQAAINIIEQNKISNRSRHLDIPVTFSHEKFDHKYFQFTHIDTKLNAADASTKPLSGPILQHHWSFLRGIRFYPAPDFHHGSYLTNTAPATTHISMNKR